MHVLQLDLQEDITADAKNSSGELLYHAFDIGEDEADLDKVVQAVLDQSYEFLTFRVPNTPGQPSNSRLDRIFRKSVKPAWLTHNQALAVVTYGMLDALPWPDLGTGGTPGPGGQTNPSEKPAAEEFGPELSFDTQGGNSRILISKKTRWRNKSEDFLINNAPDLHGAIGYSDGKIEGCDIYTGSLRWSITFKGVPVTGEYLDKLEFMTAKIGSDGDGGIHKFFGRDPYSQLFLGASGNYRPADKWVVTYNFLGGKNRSNLYIPATGGFRVYFDDVRAHDYVWMMYKEITEDSFVFQVPKAGYVEEVYDPVQLRQLFWPGGYVG